MLLNIAIILCCTKGLHLFDYVDKCFLCDRLPPLSRAHEVMPYVVHKTVSRLECAIMLKKQDFFG